MDLVDEQDRAPVKIEKATACLLDLATQVLHRSGDGRDLDELAFRMRRNDVGQCGFARTCGAIKNDTRQHVVLDGRPEPRAGADGLLLAHVLVKGRGAHANGKRGMAQTLRLLFCREQGIGIHQRSLM